MQPRLSSSPPWSSSYQWPWTMGVFQYLSSPILPLRLTRLVTAPPQNDFFGSEDTLFLLLTNYFCHQYTPTCHQYVTLVDQDFFILFTLHTSTRCWTLQLERGKLGAPGATHSLGICNLAVKARPLWQKVHYLGLSQVQPWLSLLQGTRGGRSPWHWNNLEGFLE